MALPRTAPLAWTQYVIDRRWRCSSIPAFKSTAVVLRFRFSTLLFLPDPFPVVPRGRDLVVVPTLYVSCYHPVLLALYV